MKTLLPVALVAALFASACTTTSPDVVRRRDAQSMAQVQDATVIAVRPVIVDGGQSGNGAVAGGVIGGALGSTRGHGGESVAIGVLGAVAGAVLGNAIERSSTREDAYELIVQLRNGDRRSIVQARAGETFVPGDAVILVTSGSRTRVSRSPGSATPALVNPPPAYEPQQAPVPAPMQGPAPAYSPNGPGTRS